ncbi:hypothetical protein Ciccas_013216, partial [Cichlidogyrus casuarinus]
MSDPLRESREFFRGNSQEKVPLSVLQQITQYLDTHKTWELYSEMHSPSEVKGLKIWSTEKLLQVIANCLCSEDADCLTGFRLLHRLIRNFKLTSTTTFVERAVRQRIVDRAFAIATQVERSQIEREGAIKLISAVFHQTGIYIQMEHAESMKMILSQSDLSLIMLKLVRVIYRVMRLHFKNAAWLDDYFIELIARLLLIRQESEQFVIVLLYFLLDLHRSNPSLTE